MTCRRACALAVVLVSACASGPTRSVATRSAAPPKAFDSPEAAVTHYVNALAAADLDAALEATAVDDVARGFNFAAMARWLPIMDPFSLSAPSNHEIYVRINRMRLMAERSNSTKLLMYSFLTDLKQPLEPKSATDVEIAAFITAVDPARLKALKIARIDLPKPSIFNSPDALAGNKKHAAFYGADDQTERTVLYQLGGQHYWGGFQLLRYGPRWLISGFSSNFASSIATGLVEKTTPAEYDALVK